MLWGMPNGLPGPGPGLSEIRARFPALTRTSNGRPCVFADAPGGTQVPDTVIAAMAGYLRESNANTGGAFDTSRETDALIAEARRSAARLLGADPDEVSFGQNTTSLAFAVSRSIAAELKPSDEVVVTVLDHDANVAPWLAAAADSGATVHWADLREPDCSLDLYSLEGVLGDRTRVVAFTLASNAVGSITPAAEVVRLVRRHAPRAIIVADGVHLAQHRAVDAHTLGADVLFCSAYKFFGPHLGLMVARAEAQAAWRPYRVRPQYDTPPDRWETGTLSHEALAGLMATVEYLEWVGGMQAVRATEYELTVRFLSGLREVPGVTLYGIADPARADERTPTFAIRLAGWSPRALAEELGRRGIFVWDGNYFALAVMERLGLESTGGAVRIGFCHYNTTEEADRVLDELRGLGRLEPLFR
jgi:cysteine desulfurase family protein (TIGR01976 family)